MERRKLILKLLLWSLGIAAAAGAFAVLLPVSNVVPRVMLTGLATALMAFIALPLSMLLERREGRTAALFGLCVVVVEFLLALVMIWGESWFSNRVEERIGLTMLFVGLTGAPTMLLLWLHRKNGGRLAAWVGVPLCAATLVSLLIGNWATRSWIFDDEWIATGATLGLIGSLGVLMLIGVGSEARRGPVALGLVLAGVAITAVAIVLFLLEFWWRPFRIDEELLFIGPSVATFGAWLNLVSLIRLKGMQRLVRLGTVAFAALTTILANALVFYHSGLNADLLGRAIASTGIVTACGSMSLLVFIAINRRTEIVRRPAIFADEMTVVCPNCKQKQDVAFGRSSCARCGLGFQIRVEEPRCPSCEYLLYGVTSGRCPECGEITASAQSET